jgi:hypothetical protein
MGYEFGGADGICGWMGFLVWGFWFGVFGLGFLFF